VCPLNPKRPQYPPTDDAAHLYAPSAPVLSLSSSVALDCRENALFRRWLADSKGLFRRSEALGGSEGAYQTTVCREGSRYHTTPSGVFSGRSGDYGRSFFNTPLFYSALHHILPSYSADKVPLNPGKFR
jgi:hypothetical protein